MRVCIKEAVQEELREVGLADPRHERGPVDFVAVELREIRDLEALLDFC